jgi:cell division protein FtsW
MLSRFWTRMKTVGAQGGRRARLPLGRGGHTLAIGGFAADRVAGRAEERIDVPLMLVAAALILLGVVMVYSASITLADSPRYRVTPTHFLARHLFALAVALVASVAAFTVSMTRWQRLAPLAFFGALGLLVIVLIPGVGTGALGARRWIPLHLFNLQPSELMKIACVLYAASFTVRKQDYMHSLRRGFLPIGLVMLVTGGLLQLQPDLGAFLVILAIAIGILFLGGLNGRLFVAISVLLSAGLVAIVWLFPYRRERIFAYLDPWSAEHVLNKGYQLTHSLIAFGRGEWFGVGLGGSVEKLHYLTEAHTDFIAAVIAEELGLVAVLLLIVVFYWLTRRAFEIGRQAVALERTFAGLVAQGIGIWIGVQSFINIGVASGLLPTKGLTLPLVSYGGSAMLSAVVAIGLLLRVDFENRILMRGGRV